MRVFLFLVLTLGLAAPTMAQQTPLRKLLTADQAKEWGGVGRINMKGAGFCTGALIAPNIVLTAAHCMYHPQNGTLLRPDEIEFLAGLRSGRAVAQRRVRRVVVNKNYTSGRDLKLNKITDDIALVELVHPITTNAVKAFPVYENLKTGDAVKVVSYAEDRSDAPSIEEPCKVLGTNPNALVLSCNVDYGASGAPVFVVHQGHVKIASVVSAKAVVKGQKVALGASLGMALAELRAQLRASRGVFQGKKPSHKSINEQLGTKLIVAKTLRP